MNKNKNPKWWNEEHDSAWDRAKEAFRRDWDQTKHDFGGKEPDTRQNVSNTVKQAAGKETIPPRRQAVYEEAEPAYRFGYGARSEYGTDYPEWNSDLETRLKKDWNGGTSTGTDWQRDRDAIRKGWEYEVDEDESYENTKK